MDNPEELINTEVIRVAMARRKYKQSDVVHRSKLSANTVSAICNGKDTRLSTLKVFAEALGLSMQELVAQGVTQPGQVEEPANV